MPASSSSKTVAKPYDRPNKGKGKESGSEVNIGAPAQHGQKSRKGKKAWRKNVDISQEETAMEQGREEERTTGGKVATKKNEDLFMVDTVGDVAVAQKLRRAPKPLRSLAILNERSAIPSLTSKNIQPSTSSKKTKVSGAEKERLRRIARRTAIASDGTGMGSAEVKTVKTAAADAWIDKAKLTAEGGFGEEAMNKPIVKAPITIARQREIYLQSQVEGQRGLETPDEGTSYNPSANSHARLISAAVEEELAQLEREGKEAERIALLGEVVIARKAQLAIEEDAMGMKVGPGEVDSDEDEVEAGPSRVVKPTKRKTQAQRNKTARNKEIAQLEAMEKTQKRLLREIGGLGGLKASAEKKMKQAAEAERLAKLAKKERERLGLQGGEKIGKHRVAKGRVTVQLGEDLAESLRQIKPEGNLFRDRYQALQKKSLIEPRVKQLPKKRALRTKEYEKHAYKRFV